MEIIVYGVLCAEGVEHETAYRLLACALRRELGMEDLPAIARQPGGKPYFPDFPGIHFNLSHSHGAAVCAVHDRPVGIDVEKLRRAPARLARGKEDLAFFREWTAKEATIKQQGLGIGTLLKGAVPSGLCQTFEELLPGWIVTVCSAEEPRVRWKTAKAAELT